MAIRGVEIVRQLMIYAGKESETVGLVDVSQIVSEMLALLKVSVSKHVTWKRSRQGSSGSPGQCRATSANCDEPRHNASEAIGDRDGVIRVTTGV